MPSTATPGFVTLVSDADGSDGSSTQICSVDYALWLLLLIEWM